MGKTLGVVRVGKKSETVHFFKERLAGLHAHDRAGQIDRDDLAAQGGVVKRLAGGRGEPWSCTIGGFAASPDRATCPPTNIIETAIPKLNRIGEICMIGHLGIQMVFRYSRRSIFSGSESLVPYSWPMFLFPGTDVSVIHHRG